MRFIRVVIGAILLLLLVVFAIANRQGITVSLDPLPFAITLPLYLLVFIVFLAGLCLGALLQWLGGFGRRHKPAETSKTAGPDDKLPPAVV